MDDRRIMKTTIRNVVAIAGIMVALGSCTKEETLNPLLQDEQPELIQNGEIIDGKYIVVFRKEVEPVLKSAMSFQERKSFLEGEIKDFIRTRGFEVDQIEHVYVEAFYGFSAHLDKGLADELLKDRNIDFMENDRLITLGKPPWAGGGDSGSSGQEIPWGVSRVGHGNGTGKTAWIIDTGIDLDHPDLNVDRARGFSVFTGGQDATPDDLNGHGTHVAGTIAALDNEEGVLGVAAGAQVVPVKVLSRRGSGTYSGVIAGVDYVAANGSAGDVANMSLGGPASNALDQAVISAASKGIVFTIAAGNESEDADNSSPARVNATNVYTLSAMDANDRWASFSNFGNPPVDYCAPGVGVNSTWKDGGYRSISGTSMAAPHAAGVLLLGSASSDGVVSGDPDGNPDLIIHR